MAIDPQITVEIFNETKAAFEIASDIVKIGLGALISGVTTFYVTKQNHKNELNKIDKNHLNQSLKNKLEIKIKMIEEISEYSSLYFENANKLKAIWFKRRNLKKHYYKNLKDKSKINYDIGNEDYKKALLYSAKMRNIILLLKATNVEQSFTILSKHFHGIYSEILNNKISILSNIEFEEFNEKHNKHTKDFYESLHHLFEDVK